MKDPSVHFVVTNEDITLPTSDLGLLVLGVISSCAPEDTGRVSVVKDQLYGASFNYFKDNFGIDPNKSNMIGDRSVRNEQKMAGINFD